MAITSEQILAASIDILNHHGVQGLTMRALANELNIKAASLYWHIKDKQELYTLITEYTSSNVELSALSGDPKDDLLEIMSRWRNALLKIRDSADIVAQTFPTTENRIKLDLALMDSLAAYGVKAEYVMTAAQLLSKYVLSFVADESHFAEFTPSDATNTTIELYMSKYPFTVDLDKQFQYGLEVIIAGLKIALTD